MHHQITISTIFSQTGQSWNTIRSNWVWRTDAPGGQQSIFFLNKICSINLLYGQAWIRRSPRFIETKKVSSHNQVKNVNKCSCLAILGSLYSKTPKRGPNMAILGIMTNINIDKVLDIFHTKQPVPRKKIGLEKIGKNSI